MNGLQRPRMWASFPAFRGIARWHAHLHGLVTAIHGTSGLALTRKRGQVSTGCCPGRIEAGKPLPQIFLWHFSLWERRPRRDSTIELANHIWATACLEGTPCHRQASRLPL